MKAIAKTNGDNRWGPKCNIPNPPPPSEKAPVLLPYDKTGKITEYKTLVAESYHLIEKAANELLTLGYEVQQIIPVLSGRIVLLGSK